MNNKNMYIAFFASCFTGAETLPTCTIVYINHRCKQNHIMIYPIFDYISTITEYRMNVI